MKKNLPKELTSYDFLKTLAVILMITDHVGYHFYPDEVWFRVIGRLCIPIWFFLVGYAKTSKISPGLWIGAVIISASALVAGQFLLPLNILFSIIVARWLRSGLVARALHSPETLRGMFLILAFAILPTSIAFEYGTAGMIFVLFGFMVRHRQEVSDRIGRNYQILYAVVSFFLFFIMQGIGFPYLSEIHTLVLAAGLVFVGVILWSFQGKVYPELTRKLPAVLVFPVQILGRRTLEIYVLHILVFRGVCMYLYPDKYGFLDWHWIPASMIAAFI